MKAVVATIILRLLAFWAYAGDPEHNCTILPMKAIEFDQYTPTDILTRVMLTQGSREIRKLGRQLEISFLIERSDIEESVGDHTIVALAKADAGSPVQCFRVPYRINGINECTHPVHKHQCHPSTECLDTPVSYECRCKDDDVALTVEGFTKCQGSKSTADCCAGLEECKKSFMCGVERGAVEMTLHGLKEVHVLQGDPNYEDPMVSLHDKSPSGSKKRTTVKITPSDDILNGETLNEVGTYTITYSVDSPPLRLTRRIVVDDINECKRGKDHPWRARCHPWARCVNTEGSYQCVCSPGSTGDGFDGSKRGPNEVDRLPANYNHTAGAVHGCFDTVPPKLQVHHGNVPRVKTMVCRTLAMQELPGCRRDYAAELSEMLELKKINLRSQEYFKATDIVNGREEDLTEQVKMEKPRISPTDPNVVVVPLVVQDRSGNQARGELKVRIEEVSLDQMLASPSRHAQSESTPARECTEDRTAKERWAQERASLQREIKAAQAAKEKAEKELRQARASPPVSTCEARSEAPNVSSSGPTGNAKGLPLPSAKQVGGAGARMVKRHDSPPSPFAKNDDAVNEDALTSWLHTMGLLIIFTVALGAGLLLACRGSSSAPAADVMTERVYQESPMPIRTRPSRGVDGPPSPMRSFRPPVSATRSPFSPGT